MPHTDEWIEDRIRFRARKNGLTSARCRFFGEWPTDTKNYLNDAVSEYDAGRPVLLAYENPTHWSLIKTQSLVGEIEGERRLMQFNEIEEITSRDFPPANWREMTFEEVGRLKHSWEYLVITETNGTRISFWVPPGSEAFAFWNIVLMLARMHS